MHLLKMCCFILSDAKVMSKTVLEETYAQFKISYFEIQMRYSVEFSHLAQLSLSPSLPISAVSPGLSRALHIHPTVPLLHLNDRTRKGLTEKWSEVGWRSGEEKGGARGKTAEREERGRRRRRRGCGVERWQG